MHAHVHEPAAEPTGRRNISELTVGGMTCQNCARHVTEAIQSVPGVASADVGLENGRATVRWKSGAETSVETVVRAVKQAGYDATPAEAACCHADGPPGSALETWKFTVILGATLTLPLIIGEWVFGWGTSDAFKWIAFSLSTPVMIVCGARFFRGAWSQLKRGGSNMDTLVALGSSTAFGFSLWGLLTGWHGHLYFMEAAAIITLISAGHFIEALVGSRAAGSLRALMNLAPQTARKLDPDGEETEVPVASLRAGDRAVLKPGDRVPTDGEVIEGGSAVDESMLTGESLPVEKAAGAKLYTGTVNQNGRLVMRVIATGEATALAQIIAVVQRAQNSRANIQKLGDRVSNVFVPVVVLIALATASWWGFAYAHALSVGQSIAPYLWPVHFPATALAAAFIQAAAVLIVACPCAMGLATPAAIMAGTNAAAQRGILIRDGAALEKSGTITAIVFDKTGTLTQGRLSVAAVEDLRDASNRSVPVEELAAALAQPSNHPLSLAVAAQDRGAQAAGLPDPAARRIQSSDWQELRGKGVQAGLDGSLFRLGSLNWLRETGVDLTRATKFVNDWSAQGATILGLAADAQLVGLLALRDTIKPHAGEVVRQLNQQGKATYLITGDNRLTAAAIAEQVGIAKENVFAEIRPERKAEMVKQLQQRGERVAFVGDGINDAPALEQADLGIAVAKASDVAREAADIILLKSDIQAIPEALGFAQAALLTIKQNLFWAFFYNAASIPLAALGFLSPVICAAAMGLSDLVVIGNALRLRKWKV
ncbi:MAG TPA: cation-translocating P-type ATPase [Candidatus Angelobacter sp.]|nr:cation-translocating P-type ATPase [Candidatus Angelobacter sp.]